MSKTGYPRHSSRLPSQPLSDTNSHYGDAFFEGNHIQSLRDTGKNSQTIWKQLTDSVHERTRLMQNLQNEIEKRFLKLKEEAKALAEEKKLVEIWKQEALQIKKETASERMKIAEHLNKVVAERELMERTSTDIAVQLAELKRTQREIEKNNKEIHRSNVACDQDDLPLAKRLKVAARKKAATTLDTDANLLKPANLKPLSKIQTALQEDAPGLFEILLDKGLLEDMDVVSNIWDVGDVEEGQQDDFKDLTAVVGKLWGPPSGLLKTTKQQHHQNLQKQSNYCLHCLISLIEQCKSLKLRKWPVKAGWCRTLCSFIFVFENHNRIVLERPEYGYATYFFELVQSLPVKWQVERLIHVMSAIANCRAALLENRHFDKELLPEEARVLEEYGWKAESGIASLLNFCDRVSHDYKKSEEEMGEWRSKIGKLLMDGYDHGRIISTVPRKLVTVALPATTAAAGVKKIVKMESLC